MLWELSTHEWIVSFGFVCCLTYIAGWLADGILEHNAFGHIGNWLFLLMGSYIAMFVFNKEGYEFESYPLFTLGCVAGGACALFLVMCTTKRIFAR